MLEKLEMFGVCGALGYFWGQFSGGIVIELIECGDQFGLLLGQLMQKRLGSQIRDSHRRREANWKYRKGGAKLVVESVIQVHPFFGRFNPFNWSVKGIDLICKSRQDLI